MITCVVCGCTDAEACIVGSQRCAWVEFEPGVIEYNGQGLCSFCVEEMEEPDLEFNHALHMALDRGLNKPTDSERDAPLVETFTEHEADLFLRARRAGA